MHTRMCVINSRNARELSSSGDICVSIKTKRHRELSCIADGNVKLCSYCTKQPDGASEVKYRITMFDLFLLLGKYGEELNARAQIVVHQFPY